MTDLIEDERPGDEDPSDGAVEEPDHGEADTEETEEPATDDGEAGT